MNYCSDFSELYSKCCGSSSISVSLKNNNKYNLSKPNSRTLDGVNASLYEALRVLEELEHDRSSYTDTKKRIPQHAYGNPISAETDFNLIDIIDRINKDIEIVRERNREIKSGLKDEMIDILRCAKIGAPFSGDLALRVRSLENKIIRVSSTKLTNHAVFGDDAIDKNELKSDLGYVKEAFDFSKHCLEAYMDELKDPFSDSPLGMYATDAQIAALTPEEQATIRQYRGVLADKIQYGLDCLLGKGRG